MGSESWTDAVQAVAGLASVALTLVGFFFILRQMRQVERSLRGDVCERLYSQNLELLRLFADYPELTPYFYEGVDLQPGDAHYHRGLIVAEVTASFFELVTMQLPELPPSSRRGWEACMRDSYESSPFLQRYLGEYGEWYNAEMLRLCRGEASTGAAAT